jgi:serine/threonine protein kinase
MITGHFGHLFDLVQANSLDEDTIAVMSARVLHAIAYLHELGYAHHNIKFDTVFLGANDHRTGALSILADDCRTSQWTCGRSE